MVLRRRRRTSSTTQLTRAGATDAGLTAGDVGRALRRTRTRQGLSVDDVAARTGIPVTHVRAAETGALDLPDQLSTLQTVRSYADFLGLPGDRYALALLEQSSTAPDPGQPATALVLGLGTAIRGASRAAPAVREGPGRVPGHGSVTGPPTVTLPSVAAGPVEQATAPPVTSRPAVAAAVPAEARPAPGHPQPSRAAAANDPVRNGQTAGTPSVQGAAHVERTPPPVGGAPSPPPRPEAAPRAPTPLLAVVWVVALAVVVAIVALVIDEVRPGWLRTLGLAHDAPSTAPGPTTQTTAGAHSTAPSTAAGGSGSAAVGKTLHPSVTSASTATFDVGTSPFVLRVAAVGGDSWVDATSPTSPAPLYSGLLDPGQSRTFTVSGSAVVQVGSVAGRMSVTVGSKRVLTTYTPPAAPYTVTFRSSG